MNEIPGRNRAEPHRRPLRHTFQEGPGFLFLATRGGRPPGGASRLDLAGLRFRARCVRVAREEGIAAALALGASRASLHHWRTRHATGGLEALLDRPRGPGRERLPAWVEQAVIVVRLLTYWNSKRLAAEFTRREIYPLDHHAVDGLLSEHGTARPSVRRERGPAYERGRPNEFWHIDIKGGCGRGECPFFGCWCCKPQPSEGTSMGQSWCAPHVGRSAAPGPNQSRAAGRSRPRLYTRNQPPHAAKRDADGPG